MADYGQVQWDNGKPYILSPQGKKTFLSPIAAAQYTGDPLVVAWAQQHGASITQGTEPGAYQTNPDGTRTPVATTNATTGAPSNSVFTSYTWNPGTGEYDRSIDWATIGAMILTGALTAGAVDAALGAGSAATATSAASGGSAAGTSAATIPTTLGIDAATAAALPGATAVGALASGVLPSTIIGTGAATLPTGAASGLIDGAAAGGLVSGAAGSVLGGAGQAAGQSLFSRLIAPALGIAGQVAGAALASKAATDSTNAQAQSAQQALDFAKQVYQDRKNALSGYVSSGQAANAKMSDLLGLHTVAPGFAPGTPTGTTAFTDPATGATWTPDPGNSQQSGTWTRSPAPTPATGAFAPSPTPASSGSTQGPTTATTGPAVVGEQRMINGQLATWDGQGWKAINQAPTLSNQSLSGAA